jgi:hypothetical protein
MSFAGCQFWAIVLSAQIDTGDSVNKKLFHWQLSGGVQWWTIRQQ